MSKLRQNNIDVDCQYCKLGHSSELNFIHTNALHIATTHERAQITSKPSTAFSRTYGIHSGTVVVRHCELNRNKAPSNYNRIAMHAY